MKKKLFLLLLVVTFSNVFAQFPTNGIVAQYGFDNSSLADGVNGNNFTQTGTSITQINDRFDNINSAISLNGDYLTRSNISGTAITYSFWLKTTTVDNNIRTIFDDSDRNGAAASPFTSHGYVIYLEAGKVGLSAGYVFTCSTATRTFRKLSDNFIADGNWHHVTLSLKKEIDTQADKTNHIIRVNVDDFPQEIEVNGFNNDTCTLTQNFDTAGNIVASNSRTNNLTTTQIYSDAIDDIIIYNRELTEIEIESIGSYNGYCFSPVSSVLSVTNILETTGTVNITGTETFDIAYHKLSETFSNAIIVTGITTGSANLTALEDSTNYEVYVREHCSSGSVTGWSLPISFRTRGKIYVNINATGTEDGGSWANAFTDLQDAFAAAQEGQEIWVASGTYNPDSTNRGIYFVVSKENMKIYGGFAGTEINLSDRIIGSNETILSGDLQGNDANVSDFAGNYSNTTRSADNSYRIINITSTGNNLLLDGLTISDAHNNSSTSSSGAAIVKDKSLTNLTFKNCTIKDNVGGNGNAGLIAEFELNNTAGVRGSLIIENCKFINNMSRWASAFYSFARTNTNVDITIANTLFDGNIAADLSSSVTGLSGSATWIRVLANGSDVTLDLNNNTYVNNIDTGTSQSLNNFNRATVSISKTSGISSTLNATVNNCIFWDNTTAGGTTTRSITDLYESPANSLIINNSLDSFDFNDDSISSKVNTISNNPLFTNSLNSNYTLGSNSPAIDSGDNTYVIGTTDLNNNPRIFNTTVDMGAYEFGSTTLSINGFDTKIDDLMLYPNPAQFLLNIQTTENIKSVTIYSMLGTKVLESNTNTINVSALSNGTYLAQIKTQNGKTTTKRFVKK